MTPVVTPEEMNAVDAAAPESVDELVRRAGAAVAREAIDLLGGTYGRVVDVVVGKGNNGADGRDAAQRLARRGVQVRMFDVGSCPDRLPAADLVIDAAFGTGFRVDPDRPWGAPDVGETRVLAVDIPSGVDGLTGRATDGVLRADRTITFQALKPGLLLGDGPGLAGEVVVADIGLDVSRARCHRVERADVARWWPTRERDVHKWHGAVKVVAGSDAMRGAAELCTAAAMRGGAGLVSLSAPGCRPDTRSEVVQVPIGTSDFADAALADIDRFGSLVIGPGLGRDDDVLTATRRTVAECPVVAVVDGDAIFATQWGVDDAAAFLARRDAATVLTPHDGEFRILTGEAPGDDRIAAARSAASDLGAHVVLKGPTTIVASPDDDRVLLVDAGDQRLATAGSGDVLAGLIGAVLATGVEVQRGLAAAAWLHADAANRGHRQGLVAGDIVDLVPDAIDALR